MDIKGILDEFVAIGSPNMPGDVYFDDIPDMKYICVELDEIFDQPTEERDDGYIFYAKRMLTIGSRTIEIEFLHNRIEEPSYLRVHGLGKVTGLGSWQLDYNAFIYMIDAFIRHEPLATRYYAIKTFE